MTNGAKSIQDMEERPLSGDKRPVAAGHMDWCHSPAVAFTDDGSILESRLSKEVTSRNQCSAVGRQQCSWMRCAASGIAIIKMKMPGQRGKILIVAMMARRRIGDALKSKMIVSYLLDSESIRAGAKSMKFTTVPRLALCSLHCRQPSLCRPSFSIVQAVPC